MKLVLRFSSAFIFCNLVEEVSHGDTGFSVVEGFVSIGAAAMGEVDLG